MRLKILLTAVFALLVIIFVMIIGFFFYSHSYTITYDTCKKDLEERMDFCLRTCEFYNEKVEKGELTKQEAIGEIADLLVGPLQPDGNRDITQGLGKGESGYIDAIYSNGTWAFHPYLEGQNVKDITDPKLKEATEVTIKATSREWHEYEWRNPGEAKRYSKVMAIDYFEPFDLHLIISTSLGEFILPVKQIRDATIMDIILVGAIGIIFSLFIAIEIAKPFAKISEASTKITQGDLKARLDVKAPIDEFMIVSKDINQMVDSLQDKIKRIRRSEAGLTNTLTICGDTLDKIAQKGDLSARVDISKLSGKYKIIGKDINRTVNSLQSNIEKLRQALGSYSEVLGKVALGELSARVDTEKLKEEYKLLGETLNSIVSILEYDTNELKRGEAELNQTMSLCSDVLDKVTQQGDLSTRVDVKALKGKYKRLGRDINLLISGLQAKIEESKKTRS
jgi:methyl-accepting chemotaxis protein